MTALVLQARMDSGRLPRKSMLPLGGRPLIYRVMEAFSFFPVDQKILACPHDCVDTFNALADEAGFHIVPGPTDDVLERYSLAVKYSGAERIIRVTGDNPFVFTDAALSIHKEAMDLNADYAGYSSLPHGAGAEAVLSEALLRAQKEAVSEYDREHVCPYLYNNPLLFHIHRPLVPKIWQGINMRITVDTPEDYKEAEKLYSLLSLLPLSERNLGENIIKSWKTLYG